MMKNDSNKEKKQTLRKCIITKEHYDKRELIRIVKTPEGGVLVDLTGKKNGRGAYISKSMEVLNDPKLRFKIQASLKTKISDKDYDNIIEELKKGV